MVARFAAGMVSFSALSVLALSSRFDGHYGIYGYTSSTYSFSTRSVESF